MSHVHLDGVRFAWSDQPPIFDDLHLHLAPGWTGLVGENGAGKSTLLGLISGELRPAVGRVRAPPGRVVCCPQRAAPSVEIAALASRDDRLARRLRGQLGLDARRLGDHLEGSATLSGGEARRWQIGAALAAEPDVLLVDEPTNHLDAKARDWLIRAMSSYRGTGLLVSHDRALLDALTTRTLRCHGGRIQPYELPYSQARLEWEAERATRLERQARLEDEARRARRQLAVSRENQAAAERSRSNRHVDPRDHDARSMGRKQLAAWGEAAASQAVARRRDVLERAEAETRADAPDIELGSGVFVGWSPCPRPVLASVCGDVLAGDHPCLTGVDLVVGRADRLWLTGPNGVGKTTLLRALLPPDAEVLYLPQVLSIEDTRRDLEHLKTLPTDQRGRALQIVAALGCPPARLLATACPSPGEAQKLRLALGLARHVWGLFLDEPSNDLDLPSVERVEAALAAFPGAIALVSHDARLAEAIGAKEVEVGRWRASGGERTNGKF